MPCGLGSLLEHLLGVLFEFAASIGVAHLVLVRSALLADLVSHSTVFLGIPLVITCSIDRLPIVCCPLVLFFGFLGDDVHETVFEGLLVLGQSVLLPRVVENFGVEVVSAHARLEETHACLVVGLLLKLEGTTVLHELSEF